MGRSCNQGTVTEGSTLRRLNLLAPSRNQTNRPRSVGPRRRRANEQMRRDLKARVAWQRATRQRKVLEPTRGGQVSLRSRAGSAKVPVGRPRWWRVQRLRPRRLRGLLNEGERWRALKGTSPDERRARVRADDCSSPLVVGSATPQWRGSFGRQFGNRAGARVVARRRRRRASRALVSHPGFGQTLASRSLAAACASSQALFRSACCCLP